MSAQTFTIGELAREFELTTRAMRFYEDMGLLPSRRRGPSWYDPGRFWSGDGLELREGYVLGGEIAVTLPP